jgi:hypothetical protein
VFSVAQSISSYSENMGIGFKENRDKLRLCWEIVQQKLVKLQLHVMFYLKVLVG